MKYMYRCYFFFTANEVLDIVLIERTVRRLPAVVVRWLSGDESCDIPARGWR